ncbi:MAG: TolC family protein [Negativicutes bacterium]
MKKISVIIFIIAIALCATATAEPMKLSLQQAIDQTLQNNPDLKKSAFAQESSQAALQKAKAGNYPTVTLNLGCNPPIGGTWSISGGGSNSVQSTTTNASLDLNYQLYAGGSVKYGIKQAETILQQSDITIQKTRQSLKYDAVKAYFDVINAKNQITVQETALANSTEHLRVVTAQYEEGSVPKGDVLRSKVTVSTNKQALIVARNTYSKALLSLKNIMNIRAKTEIELTETLSLATKNINSEDLLTYTSKNNPDLQIAALSIQVDEYNYKIQLAGYYPTISLTASGFHGYNSESGGAFDYTNNLGLTIGANLSFNLFDGYKVKSQSEVAELQIEQDKQTLESLKLNTDLTVNSAIDDIAAAWEVINTAQASLASATEDLEIKQVRYESGVGTNIDVLDAQKALTTDQTSYWEAVYKYNLSIAYLEKVTGVPVH